MITPTPQLAQHDSWKHQLARAISDPRELLARLELPPVLLEPARAAAAQFPLRVTEHYLGLIEKGDPDDPLLRQVLPLAEETRPAAGYDLDPVADHAAEIVPGLLQKYNGRVLLVTTGACAIHCRYCFRRHYPYAEQNATRHWDQITSQLARMPEVSEVILSGGDPLTLTDKKLAELTTRLEKIPHLRRLRIHSRVPSVLPSRLTEGLLEILTHTRLRSTLVLHCNHPRELSHELGIALGRFRKTGVTLLNQTVLLRGVNDAVDVLQELSERLFEAGVLPYYLHTLDRVRGAAHFDLPEERAKSLHRALRKCLPGYLVPSLVREIAGADSKTPVA